MPRLRVVAGPSLDALVPISVNSNVSHPVTSDAFEGRILAYIKDFADKDGSVLQSEYFDREDRKGITWSIQVQGRFLRPISADDVLFGNTFDRPLKLPWGSGAALKFMHFIDPTLEHDLTSGTKPWALSPFISTMPHLAHKRVPGVSRQASPVAGHLTSSHKPQSPEEQSNHDGWPHFPPPQSLSDDTTQLHLTLKSSPLRSASPSPGSSPLLSHRSSSGTATPDSVSSVSSSVTTSPYPRNDALPEPSSLEKQYIKKKNRLSAGTLASLLPDDERRRARKERKRTEKLARHEQALQELRTADRRRAYFRDASHRRELIFGPEDVFTTDFCYGFIHFAPTLSLNLPGGISFDLMHYWDGQPVRFMCCERKREAENDGGGGSEDGGADNVPWGRVLWCVAIEQVPDEEESLPTPMPIPQSRSRSQTINEGGDPQHDLADDSPFFVQASDDNK
ncbi:hypothetical protein EDB86DRAFT_2874610 [Lactarius hatsudake]|nr:hypothetical protein EDB86DRAFT_2874610 [Lactarius hatsudake]